LNQILGLTFFDNDGGVVLGNAATDVFNFDGGLDITDATVNVQGIITTVGADVDFGIGAMTLSGATTVNTGAGIGDVNFGGTVDGGSALTVTSGTGSVDFRGNVGGNTLLDSLTVTGLTTLNGIEIDVDNNIDFNSAVTLARKDSCRLF
jgi:hypothetical protein